MRYIIAGFNRILAVNIEKQSTSMFKAIYKWSDLMNWDNS